jgi:hypothetical protein
MLDAVVRALYAVLLLLLPLLLVFAVYHLGVWLRFPGMGGLLFWPRVALAAALTHVLLVAGLVLAVAADYRMTLAYPGAAASLEAYVMANNDLHGVVWFLDPVASLLLAGMWGRVPGVGHSVLAGVLVILIVGTFQWYVLGALGSAALERIASALRTGGDDLPDWF